MDRIEALQQLEREVGILVRRSRRVLRDRAAMLHPDLGPQGYLLLAYLSSQGPTRAADVAEVFHLDKGAVSRAVHHLLDLDLIEKQADPEDRRAVLLTVPQRTRDAMTAIARARLERLESHLGEWTPEEVSDFVESFTRYNQLLEESLTLESGLATDFCR